MQTKKVIKKISNFFFTKIYLLLKMKIEEKIIEKNTEFTFFSSFFIENLKQKFANWITKKLEGENNFKKYFI